MINQKHYSALGSDTSSVRKFCSRTSDLISQGRSNDGVAKCGLFSQDNTRQKQPAALQLFPFLLGQARETRRLRKEAKKIKKLLSLLFFFPIPSLVFSSFLLVPWLPLKETETTATHVSIFNKFCCSYFMPA